MPRRKELVKQLVPPCRDEEVRRQRRAEPHALAQAREDDKLEHEAHVVVERAPLKPEASWRLSPSCIIVIFVRLELPGVLQILVY